MSEVPGYVVISKTGNVSAPASGATVTLYDSTLLASSTQLVPRGTGARWRRIIVNIESSHDSAANGLKVLESDDGGTTWSAIAQRTYTQAVDGRLKFITVTTSAPEVQVTYTNSANTLTTWRYSVLGDLYITTA